MASGTLASMPATLVVTISTSVVPTSMQPTVGLTAGIITADGAGIFHAETISTVITTTTWDCTTDGIVEISVTTDASVAHGQLFTMTLQIADGDTAA